MFSCEELQGVLQNSFPDAKVEVRSPRGDGKHFEVTVKDRSFQELTRIQQHRQVYAALEKKFQEGLHALSIKTEADNG
jgi:stress-induced morphogen